MSIFLGYFQKSTPEPLVTTPQPDYDANAAAHWRD